MLDKTTQIFLKNGFFRIQTQHPYVVDIKIGNNLKRCHVVYHAVYYEKGSTEEGTCCWIKHETIVSRDESQFKKVSNWEALIVHGELYCSTTGGNMTLEDDEEK